MINDVVFYGSREALLAEPVGQDEIMTEKWTGNCYGIRFHCYCTETLTQDVIEQLRKKFLIVGGGNLLHEQLSAIYTKQIELWIKGYKPVLEELGLYFQDIQSQRLDRFILNECCRQTPISDNVTEPHAHYYFLEAGVAHLDDIPAFYEIGNELLQNYKQRFADGFETTGGNAHEVNPINGSNIMYTTRKNTILIGQSHPLQQFFKEDTLKQVMDNLHLTRSTLTEYPDNLYDMIAKHLGIQMKYLEDYEHPTI